MNVVIICILLIALIVIWYLYYRSIKKYKNTNFTPFILGRIAPWTTPQEEALCNSKAALELVIQFLEHKLNISMTDLVDQEKEWPWAYMTRWEMRMLRTLRTEFTALKNKKLKEQ
jgi:hypothetical protein